MIDRRTFLKSSAIATGAATFCSCTSTKAREPAANPSGVGGYNYRLPKFKKGSRLLFQGDSITDMKWGRNQKDRNHYLGHSYVYLIAARLGLDMPEAQLDIYNRGMSGHKIGDLCGRWQKDAIDMNPDSVDVKTQEVFDAAAKAVSPEQWIWDGVHPLPQGHELIARNWIQEVSARW